MLLAILLGVGCSKNEGDPQNPSITDFQQVSDRVSSFVDENNTASQLPIPVTGNESTGYVIGSSGTTDLGLAANNYFAYQIDPTTLYRGESWDGPSHVISGNSAPLYDEQAPVAVQVTLQSVQLVGNGEDEKDDSLAGAGYPFEVEFPFGSVYVMISTVNSNLEDCSTSSAQRFVSGYAQDSYSWFDAFAVLPEEIPASPDRPGWPEVLPHVSSAIAEAYWRNIAGVFESSYFDDDAANPKKQEFGVMAQTIHYEEPLLVAPLDEEFVADNSTVCARFYESDSFLGTTGFIQTPVPLGDIMSILPANNAQFDLVLAHDLNDENSVFVGYCQDGEPLENVRLNAGHKDISSVVCGAPDDDWANLSQVRLNFSVQ